MGNCRIYYSSFRGIWYSLLTGFNQINDTWTSLWLCEKWINSQRKEKIAYSAICKYMFNNNFKVLNRSQSLLASRSHHQNNSMNFLKKIFKLLSMDWPHVTTVYVTLFFFVFFFYKFYSHDFRVKPNFWSQKISFL